MSDARDRIEAYLGIRLPAGMVEDAAALAATAAAAARAKAANVKEPDTAEDFLAVLESLAGNPPEGLAGG